MGRKHRAAPEAQRGAERTTSLAEGLACMAGSSGWFKNETPLHKLILFMQLDCVLE
jgi:hypothetical protein